MEEETAQGLPRQRRLHFLLGLQTLGRLPGAGVGFQGWLLLRATASELTNRTKERQRVRMEGRAFQLQLVGATVAKFV